MLFSCASWRRHTHDGVDPEDPAVSDVVRDEAHDEGSGGRAKRHHQPVMWSEWGVQYPAQSSLRPDSHVPSSVFLEECLDNDSATNSNGRADEE